MTGSQTFPSCSFSSPSSSSSSPSTMADLFPSIPSSPPSSFPSFPSNSDPIHYSSSSSPHSFSFYFPSSSSSSPPPHSSSSSFFPSPSSSFPSYFNNFKPSTSSSSPHSNRFHFPPPPSSIFNIHERNSPRFFNHFFPPSSPLPLSPVDFLSSYISSLNSTVNTTSVDESRWKYDVFVSFRGEDTRNSFASHLFQALDQEGFTCFRDNDKQSRGMVIESKLLDAIRHSMVSLVLFSAKYADSRWCLNELLEILECQKRWKEDGHLVLPIFYDEEPGEVRKQSGKFGEGFERCKKAGNWDATQIDKLKGALQVAGSMSGWHLRNDSNGYANKTFSSFSFRCFQCFNSVCGR